MLVTIVFLDQWSRIRLVIPREKETSVLPAVTVLRARLPPSPVPQEPSRRDIVLINARLVQLGTTVQVALLSQLNATLATVLLAQ